MKVETRHIPVGYEVKEQRGEVVVYYGVHKSRTGNVNFAAIGWRSNRQINPDFHHAYLMESDRDKFVANWLDKQDRRLEEKSKRKAPGTNPFKVGDVLSYSWGYDQTNWDFFQVLKVNPRSVVLQEIAAHFVETLDDMSERVVPGPGSLKGRPMTKLVQFSEGTGYIRMEHGIAKLWHGQPVVQSHTH